MENDKPVKRGRGRPPLTPEQKRRNLELRERGELAPGKGGPIALKNMEEGDNTKYLRHVLAVSALPPIDYKDVDDLRDRIYEYFQLCADDDMKPTVKGLCRAIGIARQTIFTWKAGIYRAGTHQAVILEAYDVLEDLWESYMQNGKINPVSGIFLGKNLFTGYSDKQEFVLTPNQMGENLTKEELEAKYDELPED